MKVTGIAICPPEGTAEDRKVTPELLASCLAKYSRSNKGIDNILNNIDWSDPDASVDRIFKFIDYGHASIGGLTGGIAITIDHCSMYLAYKIFEIAQLCDGQESSTRYIKMSKDSLMDPEEIGIPENCREEWLSVMAEAFETYQQLYKKLDNDVKENPSLLRIPEDTNEKVVKRLRKNYALDRARYLIPFATKTSAAYVMSARVWAQTLKELEALPLPEAKSAAVLIREELKKFAPRLTRHSFKDEPAQYQAEAIINYAEKQIKENGVSIDNTKDEIAISLETDRPSFIPQIQSVSEAFNNKKNRYSSIGNEIRRQFVRCSWNNIALAELRDLNRHRSGYRFTPLEPTGFYLPPEINFEEVKDLLTRYKNLVEKIASQSDGNGAYLYSYLLGTQVAFEHSTHLDKFIYEIELRTGLGAHFRYAEHLAKPAEELIKQAPYLKEFIEIGTAEPE